MTLKTTREWPRGAVRYEDGWLVIDAPEWEEMEQGPAKLIAFAGVRGIDDALRFAERYGMLESHPPDECKEQFTSWQREAGYLANLLELYIDLPRSGTGEIEGTHAWDMAYDLATEIHHARLGGYSILTPTYEYEYDEADPKHRYWTLSFVELVPEGTLRASIYYEFGEIMKRGAELRRCEDCGRAFLVEDPRQRFCDATCNYRTRRRRMIERKRDKQKSSAAVDSGTAAILGVKHKKTSRRSDG